MLGHRILKNSGDLVVARLFRAGDEGHRGEPGTEIPGDVRLPTGTNDRVAARLQAPDPAVQRLRLRNVLQHGVVLQCPNIDVGVQPKDVGQAQQAFRLAADRGPARAGRHEQGLDSKGVARAEQLARDGVPQREREHATEPAQRAGAPVVVRGDDGFAIAVGGERRAEFGAQLIPELHVVVDLTVEHQDIAVGLLGWPPAQWLVRVRDVDDGEPIEAENHLIIGPGPGFVGSAVSHQVRRAGYSVDGPPGDRAGRASYQGKQSTHSGKYARTPAIDRNGGQPNRQVCQPALVWWSTLRSIRGAMCARVTAQTWFPASSAQLVTQEAAQ